MTSGGAYIAVDWGTTNRRVQLIAADGGVIDGFGDDRGVLAVPRGDYRREIAALRERLGAVPVIAAGMVGSTLGWRDVGYVDAPATLANLAGAAIDVGEEVIIVPGVAFRSSERVDVMRGEEVQVLGAITAGLAPADAQFCQPGTHNKWIVVADAAITEFATAMTGELFALIRGGGTLAGMLDGEVTLGAAFRDGLARGSDAGGLATALFEVRAAVLLGARPAADAAAYASGILIGADVAARTGLAGHNIHLLASGALAALYASAIERAGGMVRPLDGLTAFTAGIHAIRELRF